jgi:hypothetical protein
MKVPIFPEALLPPPGNLSDALVMAQALPSPAPKTSILVDDADLSHLIILQWRPDNGSRQSLASDAGAVYFPCF